MIFSNFDPEKIKIRRKMLEDYLNRLSELLSFIDHDQACKFLDIDDSMKILLGSLEYKTNPDERYSFTPKSFQEDKLIIELRNRNEGIHILGFLKQLNYEEHIITNAVKECE